MRLPTLLHRPHSDRIERALLPLDFQSTALFALSAARRRFAMVESSLPTECSDRLETARAYLDLLEAALSSGTHDASAELWYVGPSGFEPHAAQPHAPRALARLYELLFLLREAILDESRELLHAAPGLALDCIYAQVQCTPGDCAAQTSEICAAHGEAVREERAQLEDIERIAQHGGGRAELVSQLNERARSWRIAGGPPATCIPELCSAL